MNALISYLMEHIFLAPWIISICILLAGLNFPFSIDILLVAMAFIAAEFFGPAAFFLYLLFLSSCIVSAWIAYSLGRFFGNTLLNKPFIKKWIHTSKIEKVNTYFARYGSFTYIAGRFIPFGIRNTIYLSSGIAKVPFLRFALFDTIGCILWSGFFFLLFYNASLNMEHHMYHLKYINIGIFFAFNVTVIGIICYKYAKKKRLTRS